MDTQKPDGIPEDVWQKAEAHRQLWASGPGTIKEAVARAIMAATSEEREACARLAEIWPVSGMSEEAVERAAAEFRVLATFIRSRGPA